MKPLNPMMLFTTALVGVGVFTAASAVAEGSSEKFIREAMQGNLGEVSIGKLAEQNSDNPSVKAFGTMLRKDHSDAYRAAGAAAATMGQPMVTEPSDEQQALYHKLEALKGTEFDRAFTEAMVDDHKKDIKMYEKEAKQDDAAISNYARTSLPTLRKHLAAAQRLAGAGK